ncbi:NmrA family NAD(P)-binding protein [Chitinophaga nivalis]|uniref:NmrA family NAD(P)-binding protein n=1 Tax=Chitinophaga nivalis TaxID=2991709 RepID=A0ABT3IJJ3_9BACT|nr:NmrA family NAD(P)-binding protein [Chitinophaga nivalis]MCW3466177.1 NmrA family NAD(P)-binding protein [Chitinophaga nivalis]MCW3484132.1 NmrA family NAD(P)-binding protein [Chitinophaga nivalis]
MKKIKPTIVVFGCTGTVGKEVMRQLQDHDCVVRGVLRNPERPYPIEIGSRSLDITYVSADLNAINQLKAACMGADAVFLLTATSPNQVAYEMNIIDAARYCGVRRIVKLSAPVVHAPAKVEVSQWHRKIEAYLSQNSDDFCCLRPYAFMQNWERNTFTIRHFGKIYGSLGDAARNYIDCRDVATVAVNYLLTPEVLREQSVVLAGPEAITNIEMAAKLSRVTGRKIEYVDIAPEALLHQLTTRARLPQWLATHIVELDDLAIKMPEPDEDTVTYLIARKPRIMDEYLQECRQLFKRKPVWRMLF